MAFRHAYVNGGSQVRRVLDLAQCTSKEPEVWHLFNWLMVAYGGRLQYE